MPSGLVLGGFVLFSFSIARAEPRAFTNLDGNVINAELVSHNGGKVKLRRADGKEFEVDPAIFNAYDQSYIKNWMAKTPASIKYNFKVACTKKKVAGESRNMGYKRVKNDQWSYVITITNSSEDTVSNLLVKYRVFYSNAADGSYSASSSSSQGALKMIEGEEKVNDDLAFNHTLQVTTTPVDIDTVDYEGAGYRYKDELKGCLVRVTDHAGKVILDWVSSETAMKGKSWASTAPAGAGRERTGSVIVQ